MKKCISVEIRTYDEGGWEHIEVEFSEGGLGLRDKLGVLEWAKVAVSEEARDEAALAEYGE